MEADGGRTIKFFCDLRLARRLFFLRDLVARLDFPMATFSEGGGITGMDVPQRGADS